MGGVLPASGFRASGLCVTAFGFEFRVQGLELMVQGLGVWVLGSRFTVQGVGFQPGRQ